jgi:hypothetical protein
MNLDPDSLLVAGESLHDGGCMDILVDVLARSFIAVNCI